MFAWNDNLLHFWSSLVIFLWPVWVLGLTYIEFNLFTLYNPLMGSMVSERLWKKEKQYWLVLPGCYSVLYESVLQFLYFVLFHQRQQLEWVRKVAKVGWIFFVSWCLKCIWKWQKANDSLKPQVNFIILGLLTITTFVNLSGFIFNSEISFLDSIVWLVEFLFGLISSS